MPAKKNLIHIAGEILKHEENIAGAEIYPGMQIELYDDGGTSKWRPQATAANMQSRIFALNKIGRGLDETYAINETVTAAFFYPGSIVNAIIASGQDISTLEYLQSNGDGRLKEATGVTAAANVAVFKAAERPGAITNNTTHCQVEVLV